MAVDNNPPETDPPVTDPPVTDPPVTDPPHDDLRGIVDGLTAKVEELSSTVSGLISEGHDTAPVKPPWTHRKWF